MSSIYPDKAVIDPAVMKLKTRRLENELMRLNGLMTIPVEGLLLDMTKLPQQPPGLKRALIKWIVKANEERIANGDKALITKAVIASCPIWKITPIPFVGVSLTPEALFNPLGKPGAVIGRRPPGSINKKKR